MLPSNAYSVSVEVTSVCCNKVSVLLNNASATASRAASTNAASPNSLRPVVILLTRSAVPIESAVLRAGSRISVRTTVPKPSPLSTLAFVPFNASSTAVSTTSWFSSPRATPPLPNSVNVIELSLFWSNRLSRALSSLRTTTV